MAKESMAPSVQAQLAMVDALHARTAREEAEAIDPFGLADDQKKFKLVAEREENDLRQALKDPAIRRFVHRILKMGHLYDHLGDHNQVIITHAVGRHSLALDIRNAIAAVDLGAIHQMEREAVSNDKSQEKT